MSRPRIGRSGPLLALALTAGLLLSGCAENSEHLTGADHEPHGKPALKIGEGYIPQPVTNSMAAGFFLVTNSGGSPDTLTSVTSDIAKEVTLHRTEGQKMVQQDSLPVPAHGTLNLERGGNHLMLDSLTRKPKVGEKISLELHFAKSGTVSIELPVKETTHNPNTGSGSSSSSSHENSH